MKLTQLILFLLCLISISAYSENINIIVPFENIPLAPGQVLQAVYSFSGRPIIFCYTNDQTVEGVISWPFSGSIFTNSLPVFLKTNSQFEGFFADQSGLLTLQNNMPFTIITNCNFGF